MELKENGRFEARRAICSALVGVLLLGVQARPASAAKFDKPLNVSRSRTRTDTLAAIAVDPNNKVHIAWNAFYPKAGAPDGVAADIYYTSNVSGKFSAPVRISVPAGWYSRDVTIAVDAKGHAHIVFRRSMDQMNLQSGDDLYYVTNAKGDFKHPVLLVDGIEAFPGPAEVSAPRTPLVHCDSRGYVHLTFLAFEIGEGQYNPVVYMNNRSGAWTKPALAVLDSPFEHSSCLDRNGFVHIAFLGSELNHIYYTNNRTGKFSKSIRASSPKHEGTGEPQIVTDSKGKAHIVYRAPFIQPSLYYVNNVSGSFKSWTPLCISGSSYLPQVAVDSSNIVHVAYKDFPTLGGYLNYGNNSTGKFKFSTYGGLGAPWYGWPRYFAPGKGGSLHFAVYDFVSGDAEIYYIAGSWTK
jgi:hypothetical protein